MTGPRERSVVTMKARTIPKRPPPAFAAGLCFLVASMGLFAFGFRGGRPGRAPGRTSQEVSRTSTVLAPTLLMRLATPDVINSTSIRDFTVTETGEILAFDYEKYVIKKYDKLEACRSVAREQLEDRLVFRFLFSKNAIHAQPKRC